MMDTPVATHATWCECLGEAAWLQLPLEHTLKYPSPLPVQQAVIPTVARALLSGIPMDVSLTAPTGSGKTLCYLLPALRLITCEKKGLDSTALRALILVPTKALGQQVFREIQRLTRNTSITSASLCEDVETVKEESWELVRYATVLRAAKGAAMSTPHDKSNSHSDDDMSSDVEEDATARWLRDGPMADDSAELADNEAMATSPSPLHAGSHGARSVVFSKVDLLVSTPQRLLRHLDGATPGFSLASLRLLIIDEADQVLAGSFASFVSKVVDRFEAEQDQLRAAETRTLSSSSATAMAVRLLSATCTKRVLHKILCSATLSSRIGRISEVRLRNCVHFALDSHGQDVDDGSGTRAIHTGSRGFLKTVFALPPTLQEHVVFVSDAYRHAALLKLVVQLVSSITRQHARRLEQQRQRARDPLSSDEDGEMGKDGTEPQAAASSPSKPSAPGQPADGAYPATDDLAGTGILVFCSSAEEARVMGHLLTAAGVSSVVEFTTLATESERRRALLGPLRAGGTDAALVTAGGAEETTRPRHGKHATFSPMCVVASDALMRGIDIPNIGHVIMYHPPTSTSQYVHRAGRTARAMRPGHLHVLLSKTGPSGTQEDGEMALFKVLGEQLTRTLPVKYERHFFFFDAAPQSKRTATTVPESAGEEKKDTEDAVTTAVTAGASSPDAAQQGTSAEATLSSTAKIPSATKAESDATATVATEPPEPREGSGEWWVREADKYLQQSQHHLQRMWASALETALREAKSAASPAARAHQQPQQALKPPHQPHRRRGAEASAKTAKAAERVNQTRHHTRADQEGRGSQRSNRHPNKGTPTKPGVGHKRSRS